MLIIFSLFTQNGCFIFVLVKRKGRKKNPATVRHNRVVKALDRLVKSVPTISEDDNDFERGCLNPRPHLFPKVKRGYLFNNDTQWNKTASQKYTYRTLVDVGRMRSQIELPVLKLGVEELLKGDAGEIVKRKSNGGSTIATADGEAALGGLDSSTSSNSNAHLSGNSGSILMTSTGMKGGSSVINEESEVSLSYMSSVVTSWFLILYSLFC